MDDGGRTGVDVGVLDLKFVRDDGLDCGRAEVDALRSSASGWSDVPLVNEDGGGLVGALVLGFVGGDFTVFGGDFLATGGDSGLVVGGATVGCGGVLGISTGSGSTGFGGSGSTRVGFRDGGVTSITFGGSAGGEGDLSTSGGVKSSEPLTSGEVEAFLSSGNGEAWMVGWIGCHRCPEESPVLCLLSRGGQSLPPTLLSFDVEVVLEVRGGHSLFSLASSLVESPVVCETTLELRGPGDEGGCFFVCCSNRPMRFATL